MQEEGKENEISNESGEWKKDDMEPKVFLPTEKPPNRCPYCNSILIVNYSCGYVACIWSLILLIGATCWVPYTVDGCKNAKYFCRTCDKIIYIV